MKYKKLSIVIGLLFFLWVGFIFYMSSQTAVDSGHMSRSVTKEVIKSGEELGIVPSGTSASRSEVAKYDGLIRSLAHMGMYFLLSGIVAVVLSVRGYKGKKLAVTSFVICILVSLLDEFNQMHFTGRNDNGLITSGLADIYKDAFGIIVAIVIILVIKVFVKAGRKSA